MGDESPSREVEKTQILKFLESIIGIPFSVLAKEVKNSEGLNQIEELNNVFKLVNYNSTDAARRLKSWHSNVLRGLVSLQNIFPNHYQIKITPISPPKTNSKTSQWPVVLENMKLSMINYGDTVNKEYHDSKVFDLVESLIILPLVKPLRGISDSKNKDINWYQEFYFLKPILLENSHASKKILMEDYERIRYYVANGNMDELSPNSNYKILIANTAGRSNEDMTKFTSADGDTIHAKRRAFFLRKEAVKNAILSTQNIHITNNRQTNLSEWGE